MELATPLTDMADKNIAIAATVQRERSRLKNFIHRRVGEQSDAEDILQEVLYAFVEAFRLPTPIENASAWLYQVARNRIIDSFRKKKEARFEERVDAAEEQGARLDLALPAPDGGPEAAYARSAILRALSDALDELPAEQREVFIGHELEGKSFKELSMQSGVGVNTLLARKHYAVASLRSKLRGAFDELEI